MKRPNHDTVGSLLAYQQVGRTQEGGDKLGREQRAATASESAPSYAPAPHTPPHIPLGAPKSEPAQRRLDLWPTVAPASANGAPQKHGAITKQIPKVGPLRDPTAPFTKFEEQFFKDGQELATRPPVVDTFDDLEPPDPTSTW